MSALFVGFLEKWENQLAFVEISFELYPPCHDKDFISFILATDFILSKYYRPIRLKGRPLDKFR